MQLSLDETFLANDHHTYMKEKDTSGQIRTAAAHPGFKEVGWSYDRNMRDSASLAPVICSSSSSFGFEGFDLDRFAESAPHAQL